MPQYRYNNGITRIPTFAACREIVRTKTASELRDMQQTYRRNAPMDTSQIPARQHVNDYFTDMLRAIEDELLCRDYEARHPEPDNDDPWLDDYTIEDYQPGDYLDECC